MCDFLLAVGIALALAGGLVGSVALFGAAGMVGFMCLLMSGALISDAFRD